MREYIVTLWEIIGLLALSFCAGSTAGLGLALWKKDRGGAAVLWCMALIPCIVIACVIFFLLAYVAGGG